mmetsp:Transcript_19117/g.38783  ORF Transcript_19117/g.38783 Transcript_19117/m.38783 type:complete len:1041 (-) Transcript_19117:115-3237(-)
MTKALPEKNHSSESRDVTDRPRPAMTTKNAPVSRTVYCEPPGLIRRAVSSDCGYMKSSSPSRRSWTTNDIGEGPRLNASDIFRVSADNNSKDINNSAGKQSRNESSMRYANRDERQPIVDNRGPQDRLDDATFRSIADRGRMHSPIGTRSESQNIGGIDKGSVPIRYSLSCPTNGFESPLFQNCNIISSPGERMEGIRSGENSPGETDDLDKLNVSGIEYSEEPSFQIDDDVDFPMRNLNDRFELLLHDDENTAQISDASLSEQNQKSSKTGNNSRERNDNIDGYENESATAPVPPGLSKQNNQTKPSPTSVYSFKSKSESPTKITTTELDNRVKVASVQMPSFHLHESLRGELSQGLIDRVSFYSIVRDINNEAIDAAISDPKGRVYNDGSVHGRKGAAANGGNAVVAEDGKVHVHPNPEEESKSVLVVATCMCESCSEKGESNSPEMLQPPPLGAALLDEEWWLLGAIAMRSPDEVAINRSTKLLPTFSEAMGEKDDSVEGRNPAASSRTQLWKPGRSWWEAKSGKNPWVEPVVHNNRWRYLWPLIHYHKFIAKCIKKLKRNGVDVKTSTSAVSYFLRQEVCNVSDHLAAMSKFDSEQWTSALSHFDGWTDNNPYVAEIIRDLVTSQRLHGLAELSDSQSSLLLSEVDEKVLKVMKAIKEEAARSGEDLDYSLGPKDPSFTRNGGLDGGQSHPSSSMTGDLHHSFSTRNSSAFNGSYQDPRGAHFPISHPPIFSEREWNPSSKTFGAEFHHHHRQQGMYGPQFDPLHHYQPHVHYGPPSFGGIMGQQYFPNHLGGFDHHHPHHHSHNVKYMNGSEPGYNNFNHIDPYGHGQYYSGYYQHPDESFHDGVVHSPDPNTPYIHPSSMAQTPGRYHGHGIHHNQFPASPHWSHLNISQLPGLVASPSINQTPTKPPRGSTSKSQRKRHVKGAHMIDGKAKSLVMFSKTNSPASRFVMSPQDKKSNPYYASKSQTDANTSELANQSGHEESFVLPKIEDYSADSPATAQASFHTDTSMQLMPPSVKKIYSEKDHKKHEHRDEK